MKIDCGDDIIYSARPADATLNPDGTATLNEPPTNGRFTVVAVTDKLARIASNNAEPGKLTVLVVEREMNDFYLVHKPRLREHEREMNRKNFLAANSSAVAELTKQITAEEMEETMAKKTESKKNKARGGGLAAEAIKAKKAKTPKQPKAPKSESTGGKRIVAKLFDYSIGAVLRRLGKEGVTKEQAATILKAKGIESSPITISVNIDSGAGGFNRGEPAPLTKEQVSELKALV